MTALRKRVQAWWAARHPARDDWALTQRRLYIVPTKIGLAFLLTQGVLLLASINDQLSLGYALTFLLFGTGLASMLTTHGNLMGLQLSLQPLTPGHADTDLPVGLRLHNPGRARFGIGARWADVDGADWAWTDVPAQSHGELQLRWRPPRRGQHRLPRIRIETRFPLGLFVAWSYWQPASLQWVYPAPESPCPPLPPGLGDEPGTPTHQSAQVDADLHQVRTWQDGDRLRDVLWKREAQAQHPEAPLWVVERGGAQTGRACWLDLRHTQGLADEQRWSRLTAWILLAEAQGQDWGLRLPDQELPPGQGPEQRRRALEWLALA